MTRLPRIAIAGGACAALALGTTAQAESPKHYTYVGSSGPSTFADPAIEGQNNPAGRPAAFGHFAVKPVRGTFTLQLDDAAVSAGRTLPLLLIQGDTVRALCVSDGATVTVKGFAPGREVVVFVISALDHVSPLPKRCDNLATAGAAFVGL